MPAKKKTRGKKQKPEKKEFLPNNKALFKKYFMPREKNGQYSAYLEKIQIGEMDKTFFILVLILLAFGLIMMYSASYAWAISDDLPQNYYLVHQCQMAAIGFLLMIIISSKAFDYHYLKNTAINYFVFAVCVLFMVLVHFGPFVNSTADAERWIDLGAFSFQPSEPMKLGLIMLLAHFMSINHQNMDSYKTGAIPYLLIIGFVAFLAAWQRHISALFIICLISVIMMFVSGNSIKNIAIVCTGLVMGGGVGILAFRDKFDYIVERYISYRYTFEPEYKQIAWQTRNSLIAIGSGGFWGLGLGNSRQKFLYLPESKNDFVFSILCEELGFCGALTVIILFFALILTGFKIASKAPDKFGMLLATGITVQIGLQAFLNIAVVSNTIPNTGISLPFFSYGGSALIMQLAEMGIMLNISRQSIPSKGKQDMEQKQKLDEANRIQEAARQLNGQPVKVRRHK